MAFVSFLLHGHLPFVYHPEKNKFLEEDWFNEAMTEVYIPLVIMLHELKDKNIKNSFTISLSPTLLSMMSNELLIKKFTSYLDQRIIFLENEVNNYIQFDQSNSNLKSSYNLLNFYKNISDKFINKYQKNIINEFRILRNKNIIEIITTSITHTFSPNFQPYPHYLKLQISSAISDFNSYFGFKPDGFWLPECGYFEGLEQILLENKIKYTIIEAHGILMGDTLPINGVYSPVFSDNGFAFFPRDIDSAKNVWSRQEGYPASVEYRDFHKDIGTEWSDNSRVKKMLHKNIDNEYIKSFTGIKYWAIGEDSNGNKKSYNPFFAKEMTKIHANDFLDKRETINKKISKSMNKPPLFTAPYDMELFGHWWFEGIDFLKNIAVEADKRKNISLTTFSSYLKEYNNHQVINPQYSTWGQNGFSQVWNNENNNRLIIDSHEILDKYEKIIFDIKSKNIENNSNEKKALVMLTKILFLLTSSDWPFLINSGIAAYPTKRFYIHKEDFEKLYIQIENKKIDKKILKDLNFKYPVFSNIKYKDLENYYA